MTTASPVPCYSRHGIRCASYVHYSINGHLGSQSPAQTTQISRLGCGMVSYIQIYYFCLPLWESQLSKTSDGAEDLLNPHFDFYNNQQYVNLFYSSVWNLSVQYSHMHTPQEYAKFTVILIRAKYKCQCNGICISFQSDLHEDIVSVVEHTNAFTKYMYICTDSVKYCLNQLKQCTQIRTTGVVIKGITAY